MDTPEIAVTREFGLTECALLESGNDLRVTAIGLSTLITAKVGIPPMSRLHGSVVWERR